MIDTTVLKLLFHHIETPPMAARAAKDLLRQVSYIADTDESEKREAGIHPSALARCNRQAAMELEGIPRTNTKVPEVIRRAADIGRALHFDIQEKFLRAARKTGQFSFQKEVKLRDSKHPDVKRYELQGSSDGVLVFEGNRLGVEIKGLGEEAMARIHQSKHLPQMTIPESHLLQGAVYQHCLDLKAMWFLYVKRETLVSSSVVVRIPDQYWQAMRRRAMLVLDLSLKDQMPAGTQNAYDCTMCSFRPTCPEPVNAPVSKAKVWECVRHVKERT